MPALAERIDHTAVQLALRSRLLTLEVASTGSMALATTGSTITRAAGSFVTDGFAEGMEVTLAGFPSGLNGTAVLTAVAAGALTIDRALGTNSSAGGRSVTAGLPSRRGFDNKEVKPEAGRPYIEEEYVPAASPGIGLHLTEDTGIYVVRWYGIADMGLGAITRPVDALLAHMPRGLSLAISTGGTVRVRSRPSGPSRGPIRQSTPGFAVCVAQIPWRVYSLGSTS